MPSAVAAAILAAANLKPRMRMSSGPRSYVSSRTGSSTTSSVCSTVYDMTPLTLDEDVVRQQLHWALHHLQHLQHSIRHDTLNPR